MSSARFQDRLNQFAERKDAGLQHLPEYLPLHINVVLHEDMTHSDDGPPWNLRVGLADGFAQLE